MVILRTVHLPLSTDGRLIKNAFGVVVASAIDVETAQCIATLANAGAGAVAEAQRELLTVVEPIAATALSMETVARLRSDAPGADALGTLTAGQEETSR